MIKFKTALINCSENYFLNKFLKYTIEFINIISFISYIMIQSTFKIKIRCVFIKHSNKIYY